MDDPDPLSQIARKVRETLGDLIGARGFELPIVFAAMAPNGTILGGRYATSKCGLYVDSEILAEHLAGGGFTLPINIVFTDARGEAALLRLSSDGEARVTIH